MTYCRGIKDVNVWLCAYFNEDEETILFESDGKQDDVKLSWLAEQWKLSSYIPPCNSVESIERLHIMCKIKDVPFCEYECNPDVIRCCRLYVHDMMNPRTLFNNKVSCFLTNAMDFTPKCGTELALLVTGIKLQRLWGRVLLDLESKVGSPCSVDTNCFWDECRRYMFSRQPDVYASALAWFHMIPDVSCTKIDTELTRFTGPLEPFIHLPRRPTTPNYAAIRCGFSFAILSAFLDLENVWDDLHLLVHNICIAYCWAGHSTDEYENDVHYGQRLACTYLSEKKLLFTPKREFPGWGHKLLII